MNKINDNVQSDFVTMTSGNLTYVISLENLSSYIDAYLSVGDAETAKVHKLKISVDCYSIAPFAARALVAQTAGAISSAAQSTQRNLSAALDVACNDVLAFEAVTPLKTSRIKTSLHDGSNIISYHTINFEITMNPKLINLMNKESQTERLQSLYFVLVVQGTMAESVAITQGFSWEYRNISKQISIR